MNRRAPSEPEATLWRELSAGKLGVSFRRQVVLGNAIPDFFAPALRLVVEVDGAQHRQRVAADARRDRDLRRLGCEVLRHARSLKPVLPTDYLADRAAEQAVQLLDALDRYRLAQYDIEHARRDRSQASEEDVF